MTTPYVKTEIGNKLFTIEWNLEISGSIIPVGGDTFEAKDCELISVHSTKSASGLLVTLGFSNKSTADVSINLNPSENNMLVVPALPPVRFYRPAIDEAEGNAQIALLFREI